MVRRSLEVPTTDANSDRDGSGPVSRTPTALAKSPAARGRRNAAPDRVVPRLHGFRSSGSVVHRRGGTPAPRPHPPRRMAPLAPRWRPFGRGATWGFTTGSQPRPPDGCPELRKREPPVPSLQERFALRCKDGDADGRATKPSMQGGSGGRRCSSEAILLLSSPRVNGPVSPRANSPSAGAAQPTVAALRRRASPSAATASGPVGRGGSATRRVDPAAGLAERHRRRLGARRPGGFSDPPRRSSGRSRRAPPPPPRGPSTRGVSDPSRRSSGGSRGVPPPPPPAPSTGGCGGPRPSRAR